jgi:hypothetical protein
MGSGGGVTGPGTSPGSSGSGGNGATGSGSSGGGGMTITANTTWNDGEMLSQSVTVGSGVTMTIAPGATINVSSGVTVTVDGTLTASSTSSFTASKLTYNSNGDEGIITTDPTTQLSIEDSTLQGTGPTGDTLISQGGAAKFHIAYWTMQNSAYAYVRHAEHRRADHVRPRLRDRHDEPGHGRHRHAPARAVMRYNVAHAAPLPGGHVGRVRSLRHVTLLA